MTLVIHQKLGSRVTVSHSAELGRTSVSFVDSDGQACEVALDMAAWLDMADWMDHGTMHVEEVSLRRHREAESRRLRTEHVARWWLRRLGGAMVVLLVGATVAGLVLWFVVGGR